MTRSHGSCDPIVNPNALPVDLRSRPQWVCCASRERGDKQTKVPLDPVGRAFASTADPEAWGTFEEVLSTATRPDVSGIGFVFTSDDPYVGVDLDDCRDPESGAFDEDAISISRLCSHTQRSRRQARVST